jgi:tetratricopeptide (TPR) repeat protein
MFTFDFYRFNLKLNTAYMKPLFSFLISLLCLGAFSCQTSKPAPEATSAAAADVNPNLVPMYGKMAKTQEQLNADLKFLEFADQSFASRQEGSQFFSTRGWEYLSEGLPDTAMYRFNLAWLLDDTNPQVFWGFGAVSAHYGKLEDAATYLGQSLTLEPNNSVLMVDLASIRQGLYEMDEGTKKKDLKRKQEHLEEATRLLQKAVELDSTNAYAFYRLSINNFLLEDYDQAWENLHKSREIDMSQLDFGYLAQLMEKKEDPKGIFKSNVPGQEQEQEQEQEQAPAQEGN